MDSKHNKMPRHLLFRSTLWGTEKSVTRNWVDGKVLSNVVFDNIKMSTFSLMTKTGFQIYYEWSLYLNIYILFPLHLTFITFISFKFNETLDRVLVLNYTAQPFKRSAELFKHSAKLSEHSAQLFKPWEKTKVWPRVWKARSSVWKIQPSV